MGLHTFSTVGSTRLEDCQNGLQWQTDTSGNADIIYIHFTDIAVSHGLFAVIYVANYVTRRIL